MEAIGTPEQIFNPALHNQFWYRDIDPTYGWLPIPGAPQPPECWQTAPIPNSRVDAARYVRIMVGETGSNAQEWQGDWFISYSRPHGFSEEDWDACLEFFGSPEALQFLDDVIIRCKKQCESLKKLPLKDFQQSLASDPSTTSRLVRAAETVQRLDDLLAHAKEIDFPDAIDEIQDRLVQLQIFAESMLRNSGPHRGLAHRVAAACAASLGENLDATHHGGAAARLLPEDRGFTSDLAVRMRAEGHYEDAQSLSLEVLRGRVAEKIRKG
jgi:hypothetical protein